MSTHLNARMTAKGPKKILALDGGGIRGMMTVEILAAIEGLLRDKQPPTTRDAFVLADYFDFVAGTSTGAILAACIAMGMSTSKIREFYLQSGADMFDKASLLKKWKYQYNDGGLVNKLKQELGADTTLGSDRLRTILMMVMRNASTDSHWPIWNNPKAKYNLRVRENGSPRNDCNLDIPLWQLVRASTAAPTFFPPEVVTFAQGTPDEYRFIFVDGGITTYNNPAFQAFIMATTEPYQVNWPTGEDKMLLVSIGTGTNPNANKDLGPDEMNLMYHATSVPSALMFAALNEQDCLCRVFGKCLVGDPLDREVGDLIGKQGPVSPKLFTYLRYNAELSEKGLAALGLSQIKPEDVQQLDSTDHIEALQKIGLAVAIHKLSAEHFKGFV